MHAPFQILCDFDGTIALQDVTDTVLAALAKPEWQDLEREWLAGRIGSSACMTGQIALIQGTWSDLDRVLDTVAIDPDFAAFANLCVERHWPLAVVSDGLDHAIERLLSREGIELPIRANRLHRYDAGWSLETPFASAACETQAAHCKCQSLSALSASGTIVIGDGRSDICVASRADFVFAKISANEPSTLLRYCRDHGRPHVAFERFSDVIAGLTSLQDRGVFDDIHAAEPMRPHSPVTGGPSA